MGVVIFRLVVVDRVVVLEPETAGNVLLCLVLLERVIVVIDDDTPTLVVLQNVL